MPIIELEAKPRDQGRAVIQACSILERAAQQRHDVEKARVRPVRGQIEHVIAEISTGGTCKRLVETTAWRIMDGRTCRTILDEWLGAEEAPMRSALLDAVTVGEKLPSRAGMILASVPRLGGPPMESMIAVGDDKIWPEFDHFTLTGAPMIWGDVTEGTHVSGVTVFELEVTTDATSDEYHGLITMTADDDDPATKPTTLAQLGEGWRLVATYEGRRWFVRDAPTEVRT